MRVAAAERLGGGHRRLQVALVIRPVHQSAGERAAALAGVAGPAEHAAHGQRSHVAAGEHYVSGLAAELKDHALEGGRRQLDDPPADLRRPGEGDEVDTGVAAEVLGDRRRPVDEVESPRREVGLLDQGGERRGGQDGLRGAHQDDAAAGGQRAADLPGCEVQGEVERGEPQHHADGFPGEQRGGAFPGRGRRERLVGSGGQPSGGVGEPAEVADRERHLHEGSHGARRADLVDHEVDQLVGVLLDQVGQPVQQPAALPGRHLAPRAAGESAGGSGNGFVRLSRGQGRDYGEYFLSGRVDHLERLTLSEDPTAVNVRAGGVAHHGALPPSTLSRAPVMPAPTSLASSTAMAAISSAVLSRLIIDSWAYRSRKSW